MWASWVVIVAHCTRRVLLPQYRCCSITLSPPCPGIAAMVLKCRLVDGFLWPCSRGVIGGLVRASWVVFACAWAWVCSMTEDHLALTSVRCREPSMKLCLTRDAFEKYHRPSHFTTMKLSLQASAQVESVSARLQGVPFFQHLPLAQLDLLATLFKAAIFERGSIVCREGELGDAFYLLSQGRVQVVAEGNRRGWRANIASSLACIWRVLV